MKVLYVLVSTVLGTTAARSLHLHGSGGTLSGPLLDEWMPLHEQKREGLTTMSYTKSGSGAGLQDIADNATNFATSEGLIAEEDYLPGLQMLPLVCAPVVLVFNLGNSVTGLTLTREVIAGIFSLDIRYWDDPILQAANTRVKLPHQPIEVVARGTSSGTSFVMSSALAAFGWLQTDGCVRGGRCSVTKRLAEVGFNYTLKPGSSSLAAYVKNTHYSIGYVGVATAMAKYLPFAILENRAGILTVPDRDNTELAVDSASYHPQRLTTDLTDKPGYPILGVSYLVYWQTYDPVVALRRHLRTEPTQEQVDAECRRYHETLIFFHWVYTSRTPRDIARAANFLPVTASLGNRVLAELWASRCGDSWWKTRESVTGLVTLDPETDHSINSLAFIFHQRVNPTRIVQTFRTSAVTPSVLQRHQSILAARRAAPQLAVSAEGVAYKGKTPLLYTWVPVSSSPLVFVCNLGVPGLSASLDLGVDVLKDILLGDVASWSDWRVARGNAHLPLPRVPILLVGHDNVFRLVLDALGVPWQLGSGSFRTMTDVESEHTLAEFVSQRTGSVTVIAKNVADAWALGTIRPVPESGSAKTPADEGYPFTSMLYIGLPRHIETASLTREAVVSAVEFVHWVTEARPHDTQEGATRDLRSGAGVFLEKSGETPSRRIADYAIHIDRFFEDLTVDGELFYPPPVLDRSELSLLSVALLSGGIGLVFLLFGTAGFRRYRAESAKVRSLLDSNEIAETLAECIACMRLEELDYLQAIEHPNRMQRAFIGIVQNLVEYRRYLPSNLRVSAPGPETAGAGDCSDAEAAPNDEHLSPVGSSSASVRSPGSPTGLVVHKFSLGLQRRRMTVAVIRFQNSQDSHGDEMCAFLSLLNDSVSVVQGTVDKTAIQVTNDGYVYLSWNTSMTLSSYQSVALDVVCALKGSYTLHTASESRSELACGVCTTVGLCGHVGNEASRVFVLNGTAPATARLLLLYASKVGSFCAVENTTIKDIEHNYECYKLDYVSLGPECRRVFLWDVMAKSQFRMVEWMYELQGVQETRRESLSGLASLLWDAVVSKEVAQVVRLREEFQTKLAEGGVDSQTVVCGRLLRCAQEVTDEDAAEYFLQPLDICPKSSV